MKFVWREVTHDCHVCSLDGIDVATVDHALRLRPEYPKRDWRIAILGDMYAWDEVFRSYLDARNLESAKSTAEARVKWAIECLYKKLTDKEPL